MEKVDRIIKTGIICAILFTIASFAYMARAEDDPIGCAAQEGQETPVPCVPPKSKMLPCYKVGVKTCEAERILSDMLDGFRVQKGFASAAPNHQLGFGARDWSFYMRTNGVSYGNLQGRLDVMMREFNQSLSIGSSLLAESVAMARVPENDPYGVSAALYQEITTDPTAASQLLKDAGYIGVGIVENNGLFYVTVLLSK